MKTVNSLDARKEWASIQHDAISGEITAIQRHGHVTAVILPPQWAELWQSDHWRQGMDMLRVKYPGRSDFDLMTHLLQQWMWQQDRASSKDDKLDRLIDMVTRIYDLLRWVADKLGYKELK